MIHQTQKTDNLQRRQSQRDIRWTRWIRVGGLLCLIAAINVAGRVHSEENSPPHKSTLKTFSGEFIAITPGMGKFPVEFRMGPATTAADSQSPELIKMTAPFKISKYEVWQQLYADVMGGNPSRWQGPRNSVEQVTWLQANEFCHKVTVMMREQQFIAETALVRLPTEAEWEYCCRAGTLTQYSFGDKAQLPGEAAPQAGRLDEFGWHTGNAAGNDPAVGVLKPNPWGLFDMHGYLWEFCQEDQSHMNPSLPAVDQTKVPCVIRGGSWKDAFPVLSSSSRMKFDKTAKSDAVGFRCVIVSEPTHAR